MDQSCTLYVGMDVHKHSIEIALAEAAREVEVRRLGTVAGGTLAVTKALRRLVSAGHRLHIAYEGAPFGFCKVNTARQNCSSKSLEPCRTRTTSIPSGRGSKKMTYLPNGRLRIPGDSSSRGRPILGCVAQSMKLSSSRSIHRSASTRLSSAI